jgi:hypothetical protein
MVKEIMLIQQLLVHALIDDLPPLIMITLSASRMVFRRWAMTELVLPCIR